MSSAPKAVFLDRDGVINRRPPEGYYVTSPEELVVLPDTAAAIKVLNASGYLVIVATNQRCIARGIVSADTVGQIHEGMLQEIAAEFPRLRAKLGFLAVLHTWSQQLLHHPHIHCVVPAGGLSTDGSHWVACRG